MARRRKSTASYVVCIKNQGFPGSLEIRKLYRVIPDEKGRGRGLLRVLDESGEDYLYPAEWFIGIDLTARVRRALPETS